MIKVLYRILLCCSVLAVSTDAAAQLRWESLDASRQRKTLAARSLPESVRRLCESDCDCDGQTVAEAVSQMTVRCKDRNRAALYTYLYDRLHEQRQVEASTDAVVLQLYAGYVLMRIDSGGDCRAMCRWAYTLARHYVSAGGAEAFDKDLKRALGRRAKRYAEVCRSMKECVSMAVCSFEAGRRAAFDVTEPRHSATGFVDITRDDYEAEAATAYPLSTSLPTALSGDSPLRRGMYDELLWRDGVCRMPVDTPWQGVECVACATAAADCIVLTGSDGVGVTLSAPVVATASGTLFSVGRGGVAAAKISSDATVEQIGFAVLPEGRLLHAKCSDEAVSVEVETPLGVRFYQWLPSR